MHIARQDVPIRLQAPGAVVRQARDFGNPSGYGALGGEYLSLAAGTDLAPLFRGLDGDMCQAPHWGYLLEGAVTVTYGDGSQEEIAAGDLFYWPPGHSVKVGRDAELILFSPMREHDQVFDHLEDQLG